MKWVTKFTPLRTAASPVASKFLDLNEKSLVHPLGEVHGVFERVKYVGSVRTYTGWVLSEDVEAYVENLPKNSVDIDIQTPDPNDPEQFAIWKKYKQINMCGELCVAFILGLSLSELLENWEIKTPNVYKRVFGQGLAGGTGPTDLTDLFSVFAIASKPIELTKYTPAKLAALNTPIVSCSIDSNTGRLRGQGILHWVVVTHVIPERCGYGLVEIYNPYSNRVEVYGWDSFIASAKKPYGIEVVETAFG